MISPKNGWTGIVLTLLSTSLAASDWRVWLGPQLDGSSGETGWQKDWPASGPPRLFENEIGEGYSAVAIAQGKLVLLHRVKNEEIAECLDPLTGAQKWRASSSTDYVDQYGYNGGPRAMPIVWDRSAENAKPPSLVFTLSPLGTLRALQLDDGKQVWKRDLESEHKLERFFFGAGPAPCLDRGRLYLNLGGPDPGSGLAFAIDGESGKTLWKSPTGGGAYSVGRVAEIDGARQLFIVHRTGMSCFDPESGREKWKFPWVSRSYESVNAATPLVLGDLVFFSAAYKTGAFCLRVKKETHEAAWKDDLAGREKSLETHWSTANLVDGHLYGFSGRHENESELRCVELKTGKVLWKWSSVLGRGCALYSDGHFIALGERGDLALLKLSPKGHEEIRRVPGVLRYPAWTPPVLAHGILYLRDEHKLVAMDLRVKG